MMNEAWPEHDGGSDDHTFSPECHRCGMDRGYEKALTGLRERVERMDFQNDEFGDALLDRRDVLAVIDSV